MITLDEAIKCEKDVSEAHRERLISGYYKRSSRAEEEWRKCVEYHELLACWLTDYKRIKMKEGWIPTAKRLPEKDDLTSVLLTINGCNGIKIRSGWYYDGSFHSDTGDYYRMDNEEDAEMVLAWMPQPEPYIKDWRK